MRVGLALQLDERGPVILAKITGAKLAYRL